MKYDIIVAGVGGQGVVSVGAIIARSAIRSGLWATQSEVHGMAQRGGSVISHLRLSRAPIESGTIGHGHADLLIGMEPVESLRHIDFLRPTGDLLVSTNPIRNIPFYPDLDKILGSIRKLPNTATVDAERIARQAGSARAANIVMIGAASHVLPIAESHIRRVIEEWFGSKGAKVVRTNLDAFALGQEAVQCKAA